MNINNNDSLNSNSSEIKNQTKKTLNLSKNSKSPLSVNNNNNDTPNSNSSEIKNQNGLKNSNCSKNSKNSKSPLSVKHIIKSTVSFVTDCILYTSGIFLFFAIVLASFLSRFYRLVIGFVLKQCGSSIKPISSGSDACWANESPNSPSTIVIALKCKSQTKLNSSNRANLLETVTSAFGQRVLNYRTNLAQDSEGYYFPYKKLQWIVCEKFLLFCFQEDKTFEIGKQIIHEEITGDLDANVKRVCEHYLGNGMNKNQPQWRVHLVQKTNKKTNFNCALTNCNNNTSVIKSNSSVSSSSDSGISTHSDVENSPNSSNLNLSNQTNSHEDCIQDNNNSVINSSHFNHSTDNTGQLSSSSNLSYISDSSNLSNISTQNNLKNPSNLSKRSNKRRDSENSIDSSNQVILENSSNTCDQVISEKSYITSNPVTSDSSSISSKSDIAAKSSSSNISENSSSSSNSSISERDEPEEEHYAVVLAINHAYGDGLSWLQMLRYALAENEPEPIIDPLKPAPTSNIEKSPLSKLFSQIKPYLLTPHHFASQLTFIWKEFNAFHGPFVQKIKTLKWTSNIQLNTIKSLRKSSGEKPSFTAVILSCASKAFSQLFTEFKSKLKVPTKIYAISPYAKLPYKNLHPTNRFYPCFSPILIDPLMDPLERLELCDLASAVLSHDIKTSNLIVANLCGNMISPLQKLIRYTARATVAFTNVPGTKGPIRLFNGDHVTEIYLIPPVKFRTGIVVGIFGYCGRLSVSVCVDEVLESKGDFAQKFLKTFLTQLNELCCTNV